MRAVTALRTTACVLAACAAPAISWGQDGAPAPDQVVADTGVETQEWVAPVSFGHIGVEDGLPQGTPTAIVQDSLGYMWIGTEDGLARYDGDEMRVFRPERDDPATMYGAWVTALEVGPEGRIWVGTHEGVSFYDPQTDEFTRLTHDPGDPSTVGPGGLNDIHVDERGIWLAKMQGGLDLVDPATLEVAHFTESPLDGTITAIAEDAAGLLWLGTDVGLILFDPGAGAGEPYVSDGGGGVLETATVTATHVDSHGVVWVGTEGSGLFFVDAKARKTLGREVHVPSDPLSLSNEYVTCLFEDRDQRMWIGTQSGFNQFDRESGTFIRYSQDSLNPRGLQTRLIETIYQDRGGVIWVGGSTHGIALFDDLRLSFGHHHTRLSVLGLQKDADGTIWAGGGGGGLKKFDPKRRTVTTYSRLGDPGSADGFSLLKTAIWAVYRTGPDALWLATQGYGLIRFNPRTESFRRYATGEYPDLGSDSLFDIWEAPDGRLWLATWGGGLVVFDPASEVFTGYRMDNLPGLSSDHIYTIYPDPVDESRVWLGTAEGGVCSLALSSNKVECFQHDPNDPESISNDNVSGILRTSAEDLWITTLGGGLNRIDLTTGKATRVDPDKSRLDSDTLYAILEGDGRLWVSSTNGLYTIDLKTDEIVRYRAGDGLQSNEFAMLSAHEGPDGNLLFGGAGGFNMFDPSKIEPDSYVPPVVITDFQSLSSDVSLDGPIWTKSSIEVSYTSAFELELAALAFANSSANQIAYKLEGFDDDWIVGRRYARYGRLGGGDYTLRVRAANRHGVWNETGIELHIGVTPAPWRTWWAYSLYGLCVVGAVFGYRRYNQQKLLRLEQKNRLEAVERDLEITGAVQHGFLPAESLVDDGRVRILGFYRAAEACGGDWWWHEQPQPGLHHVLVGDVTGHGPGPAMVTAAVGAGFRVQSSIGVGQITHKLAALNDEVRRAGRGKYHMTMVAVEIDSRTGQFTIYSAGGTPLLLLKRGEDRARGLPCQGNPLGVGELELGTRTGQLEPGERLLLYTDGIPEIPISEDRLLGMRRFAKLFADTPHLGAQQAIAHMVTEADRLRGARAQDDDWTLVIIEWGADAQRISAA